MTRYIFSPASSSKMPPAARSHSPSTYPARAFPRTSQDSSHDPASPPVDNQTPAPPGDSQHTATQIVVPPGTESCCAPAEYSTQAYAPPATPQLQPPL